MSEASQAGGGKSKLGVAEFVAMMAALMSLNAMAIDIVLPALPQMAHALSVAEPNHRQYIVIAYVWGLGTAQLFFGPLSDRYGRRAPLAWSLVGYVSFGLACSLAPSFFILVAARTLQGVCAAGARVSAVSIIRDVYVGRTMARIMSLVVVVFMAVPMLAPNLGQGVLLIASWRWIFGVLVVVGCALAAWVLLRLDETHPQASRAPLRLRGLLSSYGQVLRTRATCGYMLATGLVFGALFAFISSSEQIYRQVFGKEESFGLYFATNGATMMVAALINARLVRRFGMRELAHGALSAFALIYVVVAALIASGSVGLWVFHGGTMLAFFCFGFIGPNFNSLAMEPLGKIAGAASAALGFASTMIAGSLGALVAQQFDGTALPLAVGCGALGFGALLIVTITERGRLFAASVAFQKS